MFTVFTEEDQKHLPVRIDLKFTPLCAAAHGNRLKAVTELLALGADEVPVVCTVGQLRQTHMAGALTPNRVALSVDRLEARGLLKVNRRSGRSRLVEFTAERDAVADLLSTTIPYARCTPGTKGLPVPFLSHLPDLVQRPSGDDGAPEDAEEEVHLLPAVEGERVRAR